MHKEIEGQSGGSGRSHVEDEGRAPRTVSEEGPRDTQCAGIPQREFGSSEVRISKNYGVTRLFET